MNGKRCLIGLLLVSVLVVALAACGGGDKPKLMYFRAGT